MGSLKIICHLKQILEMAEKEFPCDCVEFKLGGHQSELGHIHIDFAKRDDSWVIKSIWMCR